MSQLTVTALQLGLLVLLWLFVLGVVGVLRRDLFGARPAAPAPSGSHAGAEPQEQAPARPAPPRRSPAPAAPAAPGPAPRPAAERPRCLVVVEGPLAGTRLPLDDSPVLLGRAQDCTLVLGDDYASGHHARLLPAPGSASGWVLEDLGSTNGTSAGRGSASSKVSGSVPVGVGSVVKIGRTTLELRA